MVLRAILRTGLAAATVLTAFPSSAQVDGDSNDAAAVACAPSGQRLADLKAAAGDASAATASVTWSARIAVEPPRLAETVDLEGACATFVVGYKMGQAALRTGEGFEIRDYRIIANDRAAVARPSREFARLAPDLDGARLIAVDRVGYRRDGARLIVDYVGLWQDPRGWMAASFFKVEGEDASDPRIVLRSKEPLLGLSYFPAPDTPSGRLVVIQRLSDDKVRVIGFDWSHPDWFDNQR